MTDKLTTLTTNVARLLDGALALPADADREQAALALAEAIITAAAEVLPDEAFEVIEVVGVPKHYTPETGSLDAAIDALDIPEGDLASKVVDREVSFDDGADCEGCKI